MLRAENIKRCVFQPAACLLQSSTIQQSITSIKGAVRSHCPGHVSRLASLLATCLAWVKEPMKSAVTLASEEQS